MTTDINCVHYFCLFSEHGYLYCCKCGEYAAVLDEHDTYEVYERVDELG